MLQDKTVVIAREAKQSSINNVLRIALKLLINFE
jgi:hypothetical protein